MKTVSGSYTKDLNVVDFSFQIPSAWEELEAHQYALMVELKTFSKADKYTIAVSMLTALFGTKNYHVLLNLPDEQKFQCIALTNFIVETPLPVKNFFPKLKINKKECFAPSERLTELTFGEWCFAYQAWDYYRNYNDKQSLNELIAILYRPAAVDPDAYDNTGDIREAFNENLIEKRAKGVNAIEHRLKLAVYGWFTAAITAQMAGRPTAFPSSEPVEENNTATADPQSIFTIFRELLGPKWGTTNILRNENAGFVLDGLEEQRIAYKESLKSAGL